MKPAEYMRVLSRMGNTLEKQLTEDFKDDPEMLSEILGDFECKILGAQNVIINAFLSKQSI